MSSEPAEGHVRLFLTIVVASLDICALAGARLLLPLIALGAGASTLFAGTLSALFSAAPMLLSVSFGRWVDRWGSLAPVRLAGCLIVGGTIPFLLHGSVETLLPVAAFIGAGAILGHVAASRAVTFLAVDAERTRNLGLLVFGYSLAQFAGPLVASWTFAHFGATPAVAVLGAIAVVSLATTGLPHHHYSPAHGKELAIAGGAHANKLLALAPLRRWILVSSIFGVVQVIFPFLLSMQTVEAGLSPQAAGVILGCFAAGAACSRLSVGAASRRLGAAAISQWLLLGSAIGYLLFPLLHSQLWLMGLSAVLGFLIGMGAPVSLGQIYEAAPPERANEAVGLCMAVTTFLQTLTPLAVGVTQGFAGTTTAIWLVPAILLATSFTARHRGPSPAE